LGLGARVVRHAVFTMRDPSAQVIAGKKKDKAPRYLTIDTDKNYMDFGVFCGFVIETKGEAGRNAKIDKIGSALISIQSATFGGSEVENPGGVDDLTCFLVALTGHLSSSMKQKDLNLSEARLDKTILNHKIKNLSDPNPINPPKDVPPLGLQDL
jgi:hypothetical protein